MLFKCRKQFLNHLFNLVILLIPLHFMFLIKLCYKFIHKYLGQFSTVIHNGKMSFIICK